MPSVIDMTGRRFGWWMVETRDADARYWNCVCDCGSRKRVLGSNLRRGLTRSCGCQNVAATKIRNATHGASRVGSRMAEYRIWAGMRNRCNNTAEVRFADYGGRGIRVCERWDKFENFLADMGNRPSPQHSLDRIDVNGNYEPGNCRWATRKEQARNARSNKRWTLNGHTMTQSELCERFGWDPRVLSRYIRKYGFGAAMERLSSRAATSSSSSAP